MNRKHKGGAFMAGKGRRPRPMTANEQEVRRQGWGEEGLDAPVPEDIVVQQAIRSFESKSGESGLRTLLDELYGKKYSLTKGPCNVYGLKVPHQHLVLWRNAYKKINSTLHTRNMAFEVFYLP